MILTTNSSLGWCLLLLFLIIMLWFLDICYKWFSIISWICWVIYCILCYDSGSYWIWFLEISSSFVGSMKTKWIVCSTFCCVQLAPSRKLRPFTPCSIINVSCECLAPSWALLSPPPQERHTNYHNDLHSLSCCHQKGHKRWADLRNLDATEWGLQTQKPRDLQ